MSCTLEMRPVGVSQHRKCPGVSVTTVACRDKEHSTIIYEPSEKGDKCEFTLETIEPIHLDLLLMYYV